MSSNKTHTVYKFSIKIPPKRVGFEDIVRSILQKNNVNEGNIVIEEIRNETLLVIYCSSKLELKRLIKIFSNRNISSQNKELVPQAWLTKWKDDWKPFALTSTLDIVPTWCFDQYVVTHREFLILDTVSSFGTGLHETTRFMAEFIEQLKGKYSSFLDIGTGTGILSLVAYKYGTQKIVAFDIDEQSIDAATRNCRANHAHQILIKQCDLKDYHSLELFDLVCANLVTQDLLTMKDKIIGCVKSKGYLAVSGISQENFPKFQRTFKDKTIKCLRVKRGKQWMAVLFRKI